MADGTDYVESGLPCADVYGQRMNEWINSVHPQGNRAIGDARVVSMRGDILTKLSIA